MGASTSYPFVNRALGAKRSRRDIMPAADEYPVGARRLGNTFAERPAYAPNRLALLLAQTKEE